MPEGPQVKRLGRLIESFKCREILEIRHPPGSKKRLDIQLPNHIVSVDVKGKNIFVSLASGQILYNHMLMWGRWCESCDPLCGKKRLSTCIHFDEGVLGYYGGGILKTITIEEASEIKGRLGPDIIEEAGQRKAMAKLVASGEPIGEALLSQSLLAGVGNIYKSEAMFVARLNPFQAATSLSKVEQRNLFRFLHTQMSHDVVHPGIITTSSELLAKGYRRYVYKRFHQPCLVCGTKIERVYQGKMPRSTYFCPLCQHVSAEDIPGGHPFKIDISRAVKQGIRHA